MAEYIDRESLISNLKEFANEQLTPLIENLIQKQPNADVESVVRCKDCKHYVANYCTRDIRGRTNMFYMSDNDFCSYGKTKDGETE